MNYFFNLCILISGIVIGITVHCFIGNTIQTNLTNIVIGVISGVISGAYTGVICSRYALIKQIQWEVLRVLRRIDHIDGQYVNGATSYDIAPISLAVSELIDMGQKPASDAIQKIFLRLQDELGHHNPAHKTFTPDLLSQFQREVRNIKISKFHLLKIKFKKNDS